MATATCTRGPLTTLEVIAHEWTHGMIDYTSNLVYRDESGAINESLADMFGKMLERRDDPDNFKWLLGHSFLLTPEADPFRIMNDPASAGHPPYYKGDLWVDGGGVHTNSAVGNLWFSMIVDGKQGTNEVGYDFNVVGIGMDKAGQIVFNTNRAYLMENSTYNDFYQYSVETAEQLYGAGSQEVTTVIEGWKAVGLPYASSGSGFDLSVDGGFFYERMCGLNVTHPISFEVTNTGSIAYDSTNAIITLSASAGNVMDTTFAVTETILPGEVLIVTVNDWIKVEDPEFFVVNIELDLEDDNPDNHSRSQNYRVYEFQADDLRLTATFQTAECFSPITETIFYLASQSCDTMPAGTIVDISIANEIGETIWQETYEFENDLLPYRTRFAFYDIEFGVTGPEELTMKADYVNDPDPENNEYITNAPFMETIDGDYLQEFIDEVTLEMDNTIEYDHTYNSPVGMYDGESYFISTGRFEDPDEVNICPDYQDAFDYTGSRSGNYGEMRFCIDFSAYTSPYLKFDLVQFRNEMAEAENDEHTCMLLAKWNGTEPFETILFGQEEGEIVTNEYQLPEFFKGELSFKFYTELGDFNFGTGVSDTIFDVQMMDNLQLLSDFTRTTELEKGESHFRFA